MVWPEKQLGRRLDGYRLKGCIGTGEGEIEKCRRNKWHRKEGAWNDFAEESLQEYGNFGSNSAMLLAVCSMITRLESPARTAGSSIRGGPRMLPDAVV